MVSSKNCNTDLLLPFIILRCGSVDISGLKCAFIIGIYSFVAVSLSECPCTKDDPSGCHLPECSYSMSKMTLCEADKLLPDGNKNYDVNNCPTYLDVFRFIGSK